MDKKKLLKKLIIILVIIVAIIIVAVIGVKKIVGDSSMDKSMRIQMQQVEKKDLSDTISLSGSVTGETMINYTSNVESKFLTVDVEVGDEIKKGDVIATLDQETLRKQISSLEKSIANSNALSKNQSDMNQKALTDAKDEQVAMLKDAQEMVDATKAVWEQATKDYDALLQDANALPEDVELLKQELAAAEEDYNDAKDNYAAVKKSTDEAIAAAQNTIDMEKYTETGNEEAQTQLDELRKQLNECTILCKEDGIVTGVNVYEGAYNTPGATIVTVENNQSMIMTASVEETDILKLQEGMQAIVTAKALEDKELKGEVIKVIKIANASGGMSQSMGGEYSAASVNGYSVQIRIEPSELISGMTAKAKVFLTQKSNVLCVPYDVVQEDQAGNKFVLVGQDNGDGTYTAIKKNVEVGEEVNYYVEVIGGDIQEGDFVIMDLIVTEGEVFEGVASMDDVSMVDDFLY